MKYKHCPDCGAPMAFKKTADNWASDHDCSACGLNIHTTFGESHHCEPDKEKWTRRRDRPENEANEALWEVVPSGDGEISDPDHNSGAPGVGDSLPVAWGGKTMAEGESYSEPPTCVFTAPNYYDHLIEALRNSGVYDETRFYEDHVDGESWFQWSEDVNAVAKALGFDQAKFRKACGVDK